MPCTPYREEEMAKVHRSQPTFVAFLGDGTFLGCKAAVVHQDVELGEPLLERTHSFSHRLNTPSTCHILDNRTTHRRRTTHLKRCQIKLDAGHPVDAKARIDGCGCGVRGLDAAAGNHHRCTQRRHVLGCVQPDTTRACTQHNTEYDEQVNTRALGAVSLAKSGTYRQ